MSNGFEAKRALWAHKGATFWLAQDSAVLPSFEAVVPSLGMTSVRCQQLAEQNSLRGSILPGIAGLCFGQPETITGPELTIPSPLLMQCGCRPAVGCFGTDHLFMRAERE